MAACSRAISFWRIPSAPTPGAAGWTSSFSGWTGGPVWNAEIVTADLAFEDVVDALAWARVEALLTPEELAEEFRMEQKPVFMKALKLWEIRFPEPRPHAVFGGLTRRAYEEKLKAEIRAQEPPAIHESFALDPSFASGVGLSMVVDAPQLDRPTIEQAIRRFRALGERDWRSPEPVPQDGLVGDGGRSSS